MTSLRCSLIALVGLVAGACNTARVDDPSPHDVRMDAPKFDGSPYVELAGEYQVHAWPRAIRSVQPGSRFSRSNVVTQFSDPNRGIEREYRPELRGKALHIKAFLFGSFSLREALDDAAEVWLSYGSVGDGVAIAVIFGLPEKAATHLLDLPEDSSRNLSVFRDASTKSLDEALARGPGLPEKRPLTLVNGLGQLVILRGDGTWIVASPEARKRAEALAEKALVPTPPPTDGALAVGRVDASLLRSRFADLGDLGLSVRDATFALRAPRTWTFAVSFNGDDAERARLACDALQRSLHNGDDPSDDFGGRRTCSKSGNTILAQIRVPDRLSYGLRTVRQGGDVVSVEPSVGEAVHDASP